MTASSPILFSTLIHKGLHIVECAEGVSREDIIKATRGDHCLKQPVVAKAMAGPRKPKPEADAAPFSPRKGTKQAELIALLQAPDGVSIADISAVTGWQTHSVRGAISGQLKKKLGLAVISERVEGRGRVYRIGAPDEWPSAGVGRRSRRS